MNITYCAVRQASCLKMSKILVCVILLFVTDVVVCKPDYIFNRDVDGWLKFHPDPATWQEAFMTCYYEGAVLASPLDANLATALRDIMSDSSLDNSIHLGVHAFTQNSRGDFFSVEGVPLADLSIIWGSYGNGKTPEKCLSLATNGRMYISSCTLWLPYVCYKKKDNTTIFNQCGTFDDEYIFNRDTGSCYKHHKKSRSWVTAHKICAAEGAYLLIINDQREANIIAKEYLSSPSSGAWSESVLVGLRDVNQDNTWLTLQGQKIENVFNAWDPNYNKGNDYCGFFLRQGTLGTIECEVQYGTGYSFICEKDPKTSRFQNISAEDEDN